MNLADIRERSRACEKARDDAAGLMGTHGWSLAAIASAADVPALLAEIERLRAEVFTLTNSEDAMLTIVKVERDEALREVAKLREWNSEIKAERDELAQRLLDARFGIEEGP